MSSYHLPLLSPRQFLLACSSLLLLSFSIITVSGSSLPDADDVQRNYLRNSASVKVDDNMDEEVPSTVIQDTAFSLRAPAPSPSEIQTDEETDSQVEEVTEALNIIEEVVSNHRRLLLESSDDSENTEDDEYDYESFHSRLNIPLPAMGASLMASEGENPMFAYTGTNEAMQHFASENTDAESGVGYGRGIFAFAGTNQAIKNLATAADDPVERGRRMLLPVAEEEMVSDTISYGATLAQIAQSRSKLLYAESDSDEQLTGDDVLGTYGSSLHALKSPMHKTQMRHTAPKLDRTETDLDRGRYMVGLEVRDIQPHQQILLDYNTASDNGSETSHHPIRIRYTYTEGAVAIGANQLNMLDQVIETSFAAAATAWSEALRVNPVPERLFPTVKTCGAASIPAVDLENGVEGADIVIYISSDNTFCGGALMHSAVCDFDQHTRPLVGNINICTTNFPGSNTTMIHSLEESTLTEYAGHVTTETGRILGASTSLFRYYNDPLSMTRYGTTERTLTCVDGTEEFLQVPNIVSEDVDLDGNLSFELRTPRVTEIVRNHFSCMPLTGARLEQGSGSIGCFGGFLDDHIFYSEGMTGFMPASIHGPSISPLTLAMLEDSSWYTANYKASTDTSFGRDAGCQFARSGCLLDESSTFIDNDASGFHCSDVGEMGCDASHSHKAKCDFLDSVLSGASDFCPMYTRQAISCIDSTDPLAIKGEYYGESSKCFHTDKGEPMCLRGECNESTGTIDVFYEDKMFSCQKDGQIIDTNQGLQIKCPSVAAVCPHLSCPSNCSGRGVCDTDRDGKHSCICDDPFDDSPGCYGERQNDEL